ncbi:hypothetical protein BX666DRAFT_1402911 [Dichotomocladium elegans]|nr:hypothetical protein BX666DRAFT_1402911 [Dichotomocladium elegans]
MLSLFQFSTGEKEHQAPSSRPLSSVATGEYPPKLPSHRLSKKPPRLAIAFHKQSSATSLDTSSTATRMRKRFSSFLLSSPIIRHSDSRSSLSIKPRQEELVARDDDESYDISTPPTSASDDLFLPYTVSKDEKSPSTSVPTNMTVLSLAQLVRRELGTVVQDVDEEIDQAWEHSRQILRHSLLARAAERPTVY